MKEWRNTCIRNDATIRETIHRIDTGSMQIALVVDNNGRLLGTVTDGDVRRGGIAQIDDLKAAALEQHDGAVIDGFHRGDGLSNGKRNARRELGAPGRHRKVERLCGKADTHAFSATRTVVFPAKSDEGVSARPFHRID